MRKTLKPLLLAGLLSVCFTIAANAEETVQINSLINSAETYNSQTVTIEGEAIGEVLERGDYAWVNVNDGSNAIGIWMKASDAKIIEYFGDYKHVGDTVRVTGVFSRECAEHGGDVDIHCAGIEIMKTGNLVQTEVSATKLILAGILLCAAIIISFIYNRTIKKKKSN